MEPEKENPAVEHRDHSCPICMQLLCVPKRIRECTHIFCAQCIETLFELEENPKCPMCRTKIKRDNLEIMTALDEEIAHSHHAEHKTRLLAYQEWIKQRPVKFIIGNTAEKNALDDYYTWIFFIKAADGKSEEYIEKVEIFLHPTFTPRKITCSKAPFEIERSGWGVFNIQFNVYWKEIFQKEKQEFNYQLSFAPETTRFFTKRIKPQS